MKLTKFVHSCLLVENDGETTLFDPGVYSYEFPELNIKTWPALNYVVITHEHPDHFHLPFLEDLIKHSPNLIILTTKSVASQLEGKVNVEVKTGPFAKFELFTSPHEATPMGTPPENIGVHYAGVLSHPGDSHSFGESKRILAMPMTAPWGSMYGAVRKITELKPEVVIPIHDWHWRPEALAGIYQGIKELLQKEGINFIIPENGQSVEV